MYHHQHFDSISSTQDYLKSSLSSLQQDFGENTRFIVSTNFQGDGHGRSGSQWIHTRQGLAFSFTIPPHPVKPSLTPIEMGILIKQFIAETFQVDLQLKWPNDLLTSDGSKCGGLLCQYIDEHTVIVGVGLNIGEIEPDELELIQGSSKKKNLFDQSIQSISNQAFDKKELAGRLVEYIASHRFDSPADLISLFHQYCFHQNKDVFIYDEGKEYIGNFIGIGDEGEALVEINESTKRFLTSSLTIVS